MEVRGWGGVRVGDGGRGCSFVSDPLSKVSSLLLFSTCARVSVCVCVRGRERESVYVSIRACFVVIVVVCVYGGGGGVAARFVTAAHKFDALPARFVTPAHFVTTW